jgi:polyhydroxybutyrate depolymerase
MRASSRLLAVWVLLAVACGLARPAGAAADPSPGCNRRAPATAGSSETFLAGGVERRAIVVAPGTGDRPVPLVVAFHGRTNDNAKLRGYLGLEEAATGPAVFAYPAARRDAGGGFTWAAPGRGGGGPDLALFDALVAWIGHSRCVDRAAVFLVGHSLGASFANGIACARGAAVVRGLASAAGGIAGRGPCRGRVPALLLHNPRDGLVPLAEGERARDALLGAPMPGVWPVAETLQGGFACLRAGGGGEAPLLWCLHRQDRTRGGRHHPHRWPGGASRLVMSFFAGLVR